MIQFIRGIKANYSAATYPDAIFFATDTQEIIVNGLVYGISAELAAAVITGVSYSTSDNTLNFTTSDGPIVVTLPTATTSADGLMSATDKTLLDTLDAKVQELEIKAQGIDNYTINSKLISSSPVLNGSDILLTGYVADSVTGEVAATDTINDAFSKLQNSSDAIEQALNDFIATKNQANGIAGLDENGQIPVSMLAGQIANVYGIDNVVEATITQLPAPVFEGYRIWRLDNTLWEDVEGTYVSVELMSDTIYNFRNSDATGDISRTNILYRWDGTTMVEISASLAIGLVSGTAFEGSRGAVLENVANSLPDNIISEVSSTTNDAGITLEFSTYVKDSNDNAYSPDTADSVVIPVATTTSSGIVTAEDKSYIESFKTLAGSDLTNLDILTKSNAGIGILGTYAQAAAVAGIESTDTIVEALGKLEYALDTLSGGTYTSVTTQIQTAIEALKAEIEDIFEEVSYNSSTHTLTFTYGEQSYTVVLDTYAGSGAISVSDASSNVKTVSLVIDSDSEAFLSQSDAGLKLDGVQTAINTAVTTALSWVEI